MVDKLVSPIANRRHLVVIHNFYFSIELFELEKKGIYSTQIVDGNCRGLLTFMKNRKAYTKIPQGSLEWSIHESRKICAVM